MKPVSLSLVAITLLATPLWAKPQSQAQAISVATHRSDGAVFPAVRQVQRQQKRRVVRLSSSTQALTNRAKPSAVEEGVAGGQFVTAVDGNSAQTGYVQPPLIIEPIVRLRQPQSHPRSR